MSAETERRVRRAVERATGRDCSAAPVRRLAGHASLRSYWRVGERPSAWPPRGADGGPLPAGCHPSHVVMVLPPGAAPEEATRGGAPPVDPFVDVQRYLARLGVRVPEILAFHEDDPAGGLMVLEDLGDETLEARLLAGDAPEPLYERAVDRLAAMRAAAERSPDGCVATARAFDRELYLWELEHFVEWGLGAWKGVKLAPGEREVASRHFGAIAAALEAEPKGFTHRDYQSRNIMVLPDGSQAVIDFQDALLGPRQYDLVALLRDSYVELPADLVDRMVRRYLDRLAASGGPRLGYGPFREVFDLLTVQRKLKDAGRFVYIDRVKGNPGFLRSIPASLRYVREAFERRRDLAELWRVLSRHVPELSG